MARPVVIDTDGGVDDAAALWWALTDPRLDVVGITIVWGNVSLDVAARAVGHVLGAVGRDDVPIALGAGGPIARAPEMRAATFIHGDDGLGNVGPTAEPRAQPVGETAAELLARLADEHAGALGLVTIGPLSTIGRLVLDDPSFAPKIADLVVMGGSARRGGNALPAGEANVAHDPTAAQAVVAAGWPAPPLLVGLDVTYQATMSPAELELAREHRTPAAAFLSGPIDFYAKFGSTMTRPNVPCHDLLAVLALVEPEIIVDAPLLPLAVDCGAGAAWGETVVDFRAPYFATLEGSTQPAPPGFHEWRIALEADVERFRARVGQLFGG